MAQSAELCRAERIPAGASERSRSGRGNEAAVLEPDRLLAGLARDQGAAERWAVVQGLTATRRRELLQSLGERRDPRALKLLAAAVWDEQAEVALEGIAGLRTLGRREAIETLVWLAEISRVRRVAEAARSAADEIRRRPVTDPERSARPDDEAEHWASFIDGDGAQLLMAVRPAGDERFRLASVAVSDQRGIIDAFGADAVTREEADELRSAGSRRAPCSDRHPRAERPAARGTEGEEEQPEIGWVRVDAVYCADAVAAARAIHRRGHRRVPGVWEFWRADFPTADGAATGVEEEALPESLLRRRLPQTATLIHFEGFRSWLVLGEDLAPFLPAAHQAAGRRGREREEYLSRLVSACLGSLVKGRQRRLWRARLLRQAALWERRGDRIVRELCLAAAWGLKARGGVPADQHPLLRAMTRASLELATGI